MPEGRTARQRQLIADNKGAMEARDSFGYWVHRRRKSLDLTQAELARRMGCALVTLRKIEADERRPSSQMAERMAQGLALPPSEWAEFIAAATGADTVAWLKKEFGTSARLPGNLPASLTSLIGREHELAQITTDLQREDVRLLTLTGPVGVGKTRLAIEAGRRVQKMCDGVYLVELASIRAPELVLPTIAAVLGVRERRRDNLAQLLADYLVDRRLMLILDNFEHLLAAASVVAMLLAVCPQLKVVVTSRARLRLYGEHEVVVPPLPLPDPGDLVGAAESAAVRLFCARAQAARADFYLTPSLTPTVAAVCRHLNGLPLAIELAAARIRLFSPQELLHRLDHQSHADAHGLTELAPRLRVLERAIILSYGLLSRSQQTLLARLAVFAGGFSLDAVQAICGAPQPAQIDDIADEIGVLFDQNLLLCATAPTRFQLIGESCPRCPVQQLQEDAAHTTRFFLLETVGEFALTRLQKSGDADRLHQRHADYFADQAQQVAAQLHGSLQVAALIWFEQNNENLRAALTWLLDAGQIERAARMSCAMGLFWQRHGHYDEGRRWLKQMLTGVAQQPVPDLLRAHTLQTAAVLAYRQGDWQAAQIWLTACDAIFQTAGDLAGQAQVYFDRGWIAIDQGDWAAALHLNRRSLALARTAGHALLRYKALTNLGWTHLCLGDPLAAAPLFDEALTLAQQLQHTKGVAVSLINLGWIAHFAGVPQRARAMAHRGLHLCCRLDERELMTECLELLAVATSVNGDARRAAMLSGGASAQRAALHIIHPAFHHIAATLAAAEATMRQQLDAASFDAAWCAGRSLRLETLIVFALDCRRTTVST
jgi:predicted ATPase/DNA-binding XRE family transcriptional regulator